MKIVKEIVDQEYALICGYQDTIWYWGLGDDSKIYHKLNWNSSKWSLCLFILSMREVRLFMKEFNYLMAFL